jgi:hypothetical protein
MTFSEHGWFNSCDHCGTPAELAYQPGTDDLICLECYKKVCKPSQPFTGTEQEALSISAFAQCWADFIQWRSRRKVRVCKTSPVLSQSEQTTLIAVEEEDYDHRAYSQTLDLDE